MTAPGLVSVGAVLSGTDSRAHAGLTSLSEMSARVRPRLILADDCCEIREAIDELLRVDYDVVAVVPDGSELVEAAGRLRPDVIVTDMNMPRQSGLSAMRRLRAEGSSAKFVFLTIDADPALAAQVLDEGGSAYVVKASAAADLAVAIEAALQGRTYLTAQIARLLPL
jgi:DNA-binding NarL/FixJ family response regulator